MLKIFKAKTKSGRRSSRKKTGFRVDPSLLLLVLFSLVISGAAAWYLWPQPAPVVTETQLRHTVQILAKQSPDAEVFDLGPEKKK